MWGRKEPRSDVGRVPKLSRPVPVGEPVAGALPMNQPASLWRGHAVHLIALPGEGHLEVPSDSSSRLEEELRVVKRRLLNIPGRGNGTRDNVIMVASALEGDGKSFVAWNLARSLAADHDQEVILIDGDFKKPHLTRSLSLHNQPGFLEVIVGQASLQDVVHPVDDSRLCFIPTGVGNADIYGRLASKRTQMLIDTLAQGPGRTLVFDSSPILRASESQVMAQSVGRIVLVIRANRTPKRALEQAMQVIGSAENCALLLNDADVPPLLRFSSGSYGYGGYGYGDGGGYGMYGK
jgi:protein-tyrosine kinase